MFIPIYLSHMNVYSRHIFVSTCKKRRIKINFQKHFSKKITNIEFSEDYSFNKKIFLLHLPINLKCLTFGNYAKFNQKVNNVI
jgi:hypothetical protein